MPGNVSDMSGSGSMDPQGDGVMLNTLTVAQITQFILLFPSTQHSKGGISISKNHTYPRTVHLILVMRDDSGPDCPNQLPVCPKGKRCSRDSSVYKVLDCKKP